VTVRAIHLSVAAKVHRGVDIVFFPIQEHSYFSFLLAS
jgi:hypothetical protein